MYIHFGFCHNDFGYNCIYNFEFAINNEILTTSAELKTIAEIVADSIDGDMHQELATTGDYQDKNYNHIKKQLVKYFEITKSRSVFDIYTMARSGQDHNLQFIVDIDTSSSTSEFRENYDTSMFPLMEEAFNEPKAESRLLEDKFGTWLSAYAPIYNKAGTAVGIVGVDATAKSVHHIQNTTISHISILTLLSVIASIPLSWLISGIIGKKLHQLTQFAEQIKDGHYSFEENSLGELKALADEGKDEIGFLALTMSRMAEKVAERETNLKEEVKNLRIEIDENEKLKQVDELVDSDLFQALLSRTKKNTSSPE